MGKGAVRSQMDIRICLRVRERRDTDLILGQGAHAAGWHAHTLNAPGKFLISAPGHDIPRRARAYLLTDERVRATARAHRNRRPQLDRLSADAINRTEDEVVDAELIDTDPEQALWDSPARRTQRRTVRPSAHEDHRHAPHLDIQPPPATRRPRHPGHPRPVARDRTSVNTRTSASSRTPARVDAHNVRTSARTNNPRKEGATTTPLLYTLPEAADQLRISRTKLYELLDANEIESVHIGRSRKIPPLPSTPTSTDSEINERTDSHGREPGRDEEAKRTVIHLPQQDRWAVARLGDDGDQGRRIPRPPATAKERTRPRSQERSVKLEAKRDAGKVDRAGRAPTLAEWMATYLNTICERLVSSGKMAPGTLDDYRSKTRLWIVPLLGKHRLDRLLPEHLDAAYQKMYEADLSSSTVLEIHRSCLGAYGCRPARQGRPQRRDAHRRTRSRRSRYRTAYS